MYRKTIRPMRVKSKKAMTKKIIMIKEKKEKKLEDLGLEKIFKFSLT